MYETENIEPSGGPISRDAINNLMVNTPNQRTERLKSIEQRLTILSSNENSNKQRSKTFNILFSMVIALGAFQIGWYMVIFNPFTEKFFETVYSITELDQQKTAMSLCNTLFVGGCLLGCLVGGFMSESLGRLKTALICDTFLMVSQCVYAVQILWILYINRFFTGFLMGLLNTVLPVMLTELLPMELRSFAGGQYMVFVQLALMSLGGAGLYFQEDMSQHWRQFLCGPILLTIIHVVLFQTIYNIESPIFYLNKYGKLTNTNHNYQRSIADELQHQSDVDEDTIRITGNIKKNNEFDFEVNPLIAETCIKNLRKIYAAESVESVWEQYMLEHQRKQVQPKIKISTMFTPVYKRRFWIAIFMNLLRETTGISFMNMYTASIFNTINGKGQLMNFLVTIVCFVSCFPQIFLTGKYGRKKIIIFGIVLQTLAFASIYVMIITDTQKTTWMALPVIVYTFGQIIGIGATIFMYISEILPPLGAGIAFMSQWVAVQPLSYFAPIVADKIGDEWVFLFFLVGCFVNILFVVLFTRETRNKGSMRIESDWMSFRFSLWD